MIRPEWPALPPALACHTSRPPEEPPSMRRSWTARWPVSPPLASRSAPGSMARQAAPPWGSWKSSWPTQALCKGLRVSQMRTLPWLQWPAAANTLLLLP
eukprot:scaffold63704_cov36-Prasinocladus_malaysianus.AAC.1